MLPKIYKSCSASIPTTNKPCFEGEILAATNEPEQAQECFNQVLSLNPFNEKAYILSGELYLVNKDLTKHWLYMMKPLKSIPTLPKHIMNEDVSNYLKETKTDLWKI